MRTSHSRFDYRNDLVPAPVDHPVEFHFLLGGYAADSLLDSRFQLDPVVLQFFLPLPPFQPFLALYELPQDIQLEAFDALGENQNRILAEVHNKINHQKDGEKYRRYDHTLHDGLQLKNRVGNQQALDTEPCGADAKQVVILPPAPVFRPGRRFKGNRIRIDPCRELDLLPNPDQIGLNRIEVPGREIEDDPAVPHQGKFPDVQGGEMQQIFEQVSLRHVEQNHATIHLTVDHRKRIDEALVDPIDDHSGRFTGGGKQQPGIHGLPGSIVVQILSPLPVLAFYIRVGRAEVDLLAFRAEKANQLNIGQVIEQLAEVVLPVEDILLGLLIALLVGGQHEGFLHYRPEASDTVPVVASDSFGYLDKLGFPCCNDPGLKEGGFHHAEQACKGEHGESTAQEQRDKEAQRYFQSLPHETRLISYGLYVNVPIPI